MKRLTETFTSSFRELKQVDVYKRQAHGRRSMVMGAISGIDIALWDLLGKICHMPVYKLLGACSDMVPVSYTHLDVYKRQDIPG